MATNHDQVGGYDTRDEDRLPWLESAEDDYRAGPAWSTILLLVLAGILIVAAAIFAVHWYKNRPTDVAGTGALIAAPAGDYKVKPDEPGGMKVDGEGDAALATSQGGSPGIATIDLNAAPEAPVLGRRAAAGTGPRVAGGAMAIPASGGQLSVTRSDAVRPAVAAASAGGALVQLGSFPSEAVANSEWTTMSRRFAYLAPLGKAVERAEVNGNVVYRLRVNAGSAGAAQQLCGKLKVAGEACFIPN